MEYDLEGDIKTIYYHVPCSVEHQSCQYKRNDRYTVPVKYPVFSNQNLNYSPTEFVNSYAQHQHGLTNLNMNNASKNLQAWSSGRDEKAEHDVVGSGSFQSCEYKNAYEPGNLQQYDPSLEFSQIVNGCSDITKRKCVLETGGYVERDCTVLHPENNKNISSFKHGRVISRSNRSRKVFEPYQIRRLQYEFDHEMYMVGTKRKILSRELNLTEKQIKIWFQNKRMKQKRDYNRKLRHIRHNLSTF